MTVVVEGVGVLSAIGCDLHAALVSGRTAFSRRAFDARRPFPGPASLYGAHLDELPDRELLGKKGLRNLSRETRAFMCAAVLAIHRAGEDPGLWRHDGVGVVVGTELGGLGDYVELLSDGVCAGSGRVNPAQGPQTGFNAPASQLAIRLGAEGPSLTVSAGTASGLEAVAAAMDFLGDGRAGRVIAGGVDAWSAFAVQARDGSTVDEPPRPFDRARAGTAFGEAAVALLLAPGARGPTIAGVGRVFEPDADGLASGGRRAVVAALEDAGLAPGDVDAVVASASGDPRLDGCEAETIAEVFGDAVPVYAVKGSVGECLGASGALQVAAAVDITRSGLVPATQGFDELDPDGPRISVTRECTRVEARHVLVNALDASGHAMAMVVRREAA